MKNKLIFFCFVFTGFSLQAQQEAAYTHYMYNTLAVNPAYAGSRNALTLTALGRFQWVGFDGAPMTQTFTAHAPIARENIGLGISFVNDKIGPTNNAGVSADFAYRMKVSKKARLSFGLKAGINNFSAGLSNLTLNQQNDVSFSDGGRSRMLPNIGAGIYFQAERFYVGASTPKLLENRLNTLNSASVSSFGTEKRHLYFISGVILQLNPLLQLKPTISARMTPGAPAQADVTANFIINRKVTLGAMYRTGDAIGALLGININEQMMFGYSFDWSAYNRTGNFNAGSHEVMLRYDFIFKEEKRIVSPRYF